MKNYSDCPIYATLIVDAPLNEARGILSHIRCESSARVDFNRLDRLPSELDVDDCAESDRAEKLYKFFCFTYKNPSHENEIAFLKLLGSEEQRLFRLGKRYVMNRRAYGYPNYHEWCKGHWGTDRNAVAYAKVSENCIAFATHRTPACIAIEKLSAWFPGVEITYTWEDDTVPVEDGYVVRQSIVYKDGMEVRTINTVEEKQIANYFLKDEPVEAPSSSDYMSITDNENYPF